MEIDVFPKDVDVTVFGHTFWIRETYLTSLLLIALILVIALIIRFALIRRFTTDVRKIGRAQLLCEYLFNMLERFTKGAVGSGVKTLALYPGAGLLYSPKRSYRAFRSAHSSLGSLGYGFLRAFHIYNNQLLRPEGEGD